jgi:hypothetical protein
VDHRDGRRHLDTLTRTGGAADVGRRRTRRDRTRVRRDRVPAVIGNFMTGVVVVITTEHEVPGAA